MILHDYYYNEDTETLIIEFSLKIDGDNFYRLLELSIIDVEFYSPEIITESDMKRIEDDFIKELLEQYLKENEPPEQQMF
jgi:hypothetical protein